MTTPTGPAGPDPTNTGGVPGVAPPATESTAPKKKRAALIVVGVVAVLAVLGGVAFVLTSGDSSDSAGGEVFLLAADDPGPDPFDPAGVAEPTTPAPEPVEGASVSMTAPSNNPVSASSGSEPGLYGGTMNKASCDSAKLVEFLTANPDKAAAWVKAINKDTSVRLPNGSPLAVDNISTYVATLTPVVLDADTRVTNYGFKAGEPTAMQSVLQSGTAVMVDGNGVPRVKCNCGNPLSPPVPTKATPVYTGKAWPSFNVTNITVVQKSTTVINTFVLKDRATGSLFDRPAGSNGAADKPNTTTTTTTSTTAPGASTTAQPPATTTPAAPALASYAGKWNVANQNTVCDNDGNACSLPSAPMEFTCTATECVSGSGVTYRLNGSSLEARTNAPAGRVCNGVDVDIASVFVWTLQADGTLKGTSTSTSPAFPPGCPNALTIQFERQATPIP